MRLSTITAGFDPVTFLCEPRSCTQWRMLNASVADDGAGLAITGSALVVGAAWQLVVPSVIVIPTQHYAIRSTMRIAFMQSLSAFTSAVDIQLRSALRDQLSVPLDSIRLSNLRLASRRRLLSVLGGIDVDVTVVLTADAVETARAATVTMSCQAGAKGHWVLWPDVLVGKQPTWRFLHPKSRT